MWYLVDKPRWLSSQRALYSVRNALGLHKSVKIGHAGTLDPLAEGALLVATHKHTALLSLAVGMRKTYTFTMRVDGTSASLDEGTEFQGGGSSRIEQAGKHWHESLFQETILSKYQGTIEQVPPLYSAVWVDGKRAYNMARSTNTQLSEHVLPSRFVTIYALRLVKWDFPYITISADVSSGTYIRSLARDIAADMGLPGMVTHLRRESIGHLKSPHTLTTLAETRSLESEQVITSFHLVHARAEEYTDLRLGIISERIHSLSETAGIYLVKTPEGKDLAALKRDELWKLSFVASRLDD